MSRSALRATVALTVFLSACAPAPSDPSADGVAENAPRHLDAPYVVLVSFDGFRWDYPDLYDTPNFDRVEDSGVRADAMIPVFPTKTFPTHYSIATGMYAENHGLVGNDFWAPDKGGAYAISNREVVEDGTWYRGEPIWVTAESQDMRAASFFFVGSEADVGGIRPTYWRRYDGGVANSDRVDQVIEWLELPAEVRPHVVTMYFSDTDDIGHDFGPGSPETGVAVADVDEALGRLLDGIEALPYGDQVYVVLVSDHGMLEAPVEMADVLDMDLFPGVLLAASGPYASIHVQEGGPERAAAVRDSIQSMMPENAVYLRADVPERFHYSADPRIGDIVIVAAPGRTVVSRPATRTYFTHGWDNRVPEMGAIFLASGPRLPVGVRIDAFESIHVYPFMAEVLGLTPFEGIDGDVEVLGAVLGPG